MMNLLAICLVLTSLLAAEVWSPIHTTLQNQKEEDVIVKEGHRTIVVETFDQDGHHNTKVSISPEIKHDTLVSSMYEKGEVAAGVLPNIGLGISQEGKSYEGERHAPGELICDALGKCKHRIASVMDNAKGKIYETAQEAVAKEKKIAHEAKDMAEKAFYKKKKKIAQEAKDRVDDAYEKTKVTTSEKAHHAKEAVGVAYEDIKESAKESHQKAKKAAKDTMDLGGTIRKDVGRNVSEEVANAKEKADKTVEEAKESTVRAKNKVSGLLKHAFASQMALHNVTGVMNLLGFSTAYGTSVWVTFISSHVLSGALPRQQFGMVQSKIYPVYFRALLSGIGLSLLGHLIGQRKLLLVSRAKKFQAYNLLASMLLVLVNALYLEPIATKVMLERMRIEKEEGIELQTESMREREQQPTAAPTSMAASTTALAGTPEAQQVRRRIAVMNQRLKKLNTYSSFINVLTLMSLTWHLVCLGHALHLSCD